MRELEELFLALRCSRFRSRFKLGSKELAYLQSKGLPTILNHARDFIDSRLAPANPPNDGKQTPMRNHPVFIAQHATATCCRGCLEKWHGIPRGKELTDMQCKYCVSVIEMWLLRELGQGPQNP
jgi:Domain of unknown function (DUF4186)